MLRRLFTLVAAFSLLIGLALAILWIRSYQASDVIVSRVRGPIPPNGRALWVEIKMFQGKLAVTSLEHQPDSPESSWSVGDIAGSAAARPVWKVSPSSGLFSPAGSTFWERLGFSHQTSQFDFMSGAIDANHMFVIEIWSAPLWAIFCVAELPASCWLFMAWRRSRRPLPGCCATCGYDLRASPGRCPECGNAKMSVPSRN